MSKVKISLFWVIAIGAILLIGGIFMGIAIQSKKPIEIDHKIRYSEILNWSLTIVVGIWVGYILKNQFENNKTVKSYLIDDIKKISLEISEIKQFCYSFKEVAVFDEEQRREINGKINVTDKNLTVFCQFFGVCYKNQHKDIPDSITKSFNAFNRKVTGDGFYENPISRQYFDELMAEGSRFEGELRAFILKIIREL